MSDNVANAHTKTGGELLVNKNKINSLPTELDVSINDLFQNLKLRRKSRYLVFHLASDDSGTVLTEKVGERSATPQSFIDSLPTSDCRFAIYDHEYKSVDGRPQSKLFFVSWLPLNSTPHNMMAYTAAKGVFRDTFTGVFDAVCKNVEDVEVLIGMRAAADEGEESSSDFEED